MITYMAISVGRMNSQVIRTVISFLVSRSVQSYLLLANADRLLSLWSTLHSGQNTERGTFTLAPGANLDKSTVCQQMYKLHVPDNIRIDLSPFWNSDGTFRKSQIL